MNIKMNENAFLYTLNKILNRFFKYTMRLCCWEIVSKPIYDATCHVSSKSLPCTVHHFPWHCVCVNHPQCFITVSLWPQDCYWQEISGWQTVSWFTAQQWYWEKKSTLLRSVQHTLSLLGWIISGQWWSIGGFCPLIDRIVRIWQIMYSTMCIYSIL